MDEVGAIISDLGAAVAVETKTGALASVTAVTDDEDAGVPVVDDARAANPFAV